MIQPRINNVSELIIRTAKDSGILKKELKCVESPVQGADLPSCAPQTLAKMFVKETELSKSVLSLPVAEKSEIGFANTGFFNRVHYVREFEKSMQEMKDALYCVGDKELAKKIKSTGDLYSFEEISKIEEMVGAGISAEKAIKCRGSEELLQISDGKVKLEPEATIKHMVEEYVNKLAVFKEKDKNNLFENTKKINKFINSQSGCIQESVLYRGEQSEDEIKRLLSLAIEKQQNPSKSVKYCPNHLFSTTSDLEVLTKDYDYADKCFIKIVGTEGKCKGIDVNKMIGSKNKFFSQKEMLLPSTSEYELVEGSIQDGRLFITLKYLH